MRRAIAVFNKNKNDGSAMVIRCETHAEQGFWPIVRGVRLALAAACALATAPHLSAADAVSQKLEAPTAVDLPAQPLGTSLKQLANQAGIQILFEERVVSGIQAPQVKGNQSVRQVLGTLLRNTGLEFAAKDETVAVRLASEGAQTTRAGYADSSSPIRVAQNDTANSENTNGQSPNGSAQSNSEQTPSADKGKEEGAQLEEIVVTGTHIRGSRNPTAPVLMYDREAIERTGFSSTQQLMRSLPQNFGGGQSGATEDGSLGPGVNAQINNESASGVNLRGLGNSATLVLLNGRRLASSAFGSFVDVSTIPLSAIDRVEVLTDGGSALYGADAVAGVVNFVLRKDYTGGETSARFGSVTQGSLQEFSAEQTFGGSWSGGNALVSLHYQDREALPSQQRSFTASAPQPTDILPDTALYSGLAHARQQLSTTMDLFGDALFSTKSLQRRQTTDFGTSLSADNDIRQAVANVGLGYAAPADWRVELVGSWSRQQLESANWWSTPPPPGYVNGTLALRNVARIISSDLKGDGPIGTLPGGPIQAAIGITWRQEEFDSLIPFIPLPRESHRHVLAGYGELQIPFVSQLNSRPGLRRFDLSLAVRHDDYSDFGGTTNPRIGVRWAPVDAFNVRAAYSLAFRPPNANEALATSLEVFTLPFASPDGGPEVPVFYLFGTDAKVTPEKSRNLSLGLDFYPERLRGGKLSLDYYRIRFRDRIITPPFDLGALLQPDVYGTLITPLADDAAATAYLQDLEDQGAIVLGADPAGVRHVYAGQQQNAARVDQSGIDIGAQYPFEIFGRQFDASLNATYIEEIETAFTATSAPAELVDTYANPLRFRLRADLAWSGRNIRINGAVNYGGSYVDTSIVPRGTIDSWTTFDMSIRYSPEMAEALSATLSVINAFDTSPPFANGIGLSGVHYDVGNADPLGRYVSLAAAWRW